MPKRTNYSKIKFLKSNWNVSVMETALLTGVLFDISEE